MSVRRRGKRIVRIMRVPFEWLGIGLGIAVISILPRRWMLALCDFISMVMYAFDASGRGLALFNLRVVTGCVEVKGLPFSRNVRLITSTAPFSAHAAGVAHNPPQLPQHGPDSRPRILDVPECGDAGRGVRRYVGARASVSRREQACCDRFRTHRVLGDTFAAGVP